MLLILHYTTPIMAPVPPPQAPFSVPPPAPAPAVNVPSQSFLSKTQRFIEENQRLIILGCAVAAASGAGYYLYSRNSGPSSGSAAAGGDNGKSASKKKNKKKKKGGNGSGLQSGFLKGEGSQGPLVEEIEKPKPQAGTTTVEGEKTQETGTSHLADVPESEALGAMSETVSLASLVTTGSGNAHRSIGP